MALAKKIEMRRIGFHSVSLFHLAPLLLTFPIWRWTHQTALRFPLTPRAASAAS